MYLHLCIVYCIVYLHLRISRSALALARADLNRKSLPDEWRICPPPKDWWKIPQISTPAIIATNKRRMNTKNWSCGRLLLEEETWFVEVKILKFHFQLRIHHQWLAPSGGLYFITQLFKVTQIWSMQLSGTHAMRISRDKQRSQKTWQ